MYEGSSPRPVRLLGIQGAGRCDPYTRPEQWMDEALEDLAGKADQALEAGRFRPLTVNFWPYGVHFIDRLLGADVYELAPGNWQARVLTTPVGRLREPDLDSHPDWNLARRIGRAFLAAGLTVPFFGTPVLSSALNIALNLYGQDLLVAMMDDPASARRDLRTINEVICRLHRWYRQMIPAAQLQMAETIGRVQPPGCGQICGCACQLLSPGLYEKFILHLDHEVLSLHAAGSGMVHLCGSHVQHIPLWRRLQSFKAFQLNDRAAEDFEAYFAGLRNDQVFYVNPTATMSMERILAISGGRRVVIVC